MGKWGSRGLYFQDHHQALSCNQSFSNNLKDAFQRYLLMGFRDPAPSCLHMHPKIHAFIHTDIHRGNDQAQRILMCYFIWQIIEPYPCGLSEEFHPYSCLVFPVETNTADIPAQQREQEILSTNSVSPLPTLAPAPRTADLDSV